MKKFKYHPMKKTQSKETAYCVWLQMYAILENAKLQRQHKLVVKGWEVEGLIGRTQSIFRQ